jgi:hypothetical protein
MSELIPITSKVTRRIMEMIVFPIIKALYYPDGTEDHKIVGTGFFLDSNGRFLSARHVFYNRNRLILDLGLTLDAGLTLDLGLALDIEDAEGIALYCVHSVNANRKMVARRIDVSSIIPRRDTDIVAGFVEMKQFGKGDNSITEAELRNTAHINYATTTDIPVGTEIWTVAFPLTKVPRLENGGFNVDLQSVMYRGRITKHYPEGRDRVMLPGPCYETDMEIKGGSSGGPVFISGSSGFVFGVNSTGMEPHCFSHVTSLSPLVSKSKR